ncbi:MAG: hypothetical protein IPI84_01530 [Holophagaceae bacterium]|nr:hypothetical protein [Holophagaceae bacterium]
MRRILSFLLITGCLGVLAQDAKVKAPKAKAPAAAQAEVKALPAPASAIVANKDSKTYHRSDCKVAAKMKASNKTSFASAAEAAKAGYKPCKICKP